MGAIKLKFNLEDIPLYLVCICTNKYALLRLSGNIKKYTQ